MEALLFFLNCIAMIVLMIMGLRDDRRRPGKTAKSYFRYDEEDATNPGATGTEARRISRRRKPVRGRGL